MLELKQIVKHYGEGENKVVALNGVSLCFRKSEFVSILGPSGCGKTTLLNIIGGLDRYTSGDIKIDGVSTKSFKDRDWDVYRNHSIGFVFQGYNLIPHLTVLENVEMSLGIGGIDNDTRKKKAFDALEKVGLKEQAKKLPNQLSGGQMQRVAIARAIITEPEIILADEPTGALDSVTSVQVMDLLKEISKERLVIMVTHNPELAEKYSTRIINVKDGVIVGDTNPYHCENDEETKVITGKTSMRFITAIKSSLKNLISKRARTILTCVASSIGIIGIALILSVSNGMSNYMQSMQADSLGEFPISVSAISADFDKILSIGTSGSLQSSVDNLLDVGGIEAFPSDQVLKPYDSNFTSALKTLVTYSKINDEFLEYLEKIPDDMVTAIQYYRTIEPHVYLKLYDSVFEEYTYNTLDTDSTGWAEILDNAEYMKTQYDVINEGGYFPTEANEIALVVDRYNRVNTKVLAALGITPVSVDGDVGYIDVPFSDLLGAEISYSLNDDYYTLNSQGVYVCTGDNEELFNKGFKLKITAILRSNENTSMMWLSSGLVYTPKFTEYVLEQNADSDVVLAQKNAYDTFLKRKENEPNAKMVDVTTGKAVTNDWETLLNLASSFSPFEVNEIIKLTDEVMYDEVMRKLGGTNLPAVVFIYPSSFQNKELLVEYLEAYNEGKENSDQISVTDTTTAMIGMVESMIDAVSYVLIAFSAISLLVSSVMIGIITYVSVMERTKEIGVLRAMGARKLDITRIFNAETLIIGSLSGVLAIVVTYLLDILVSLILKNLTGIPSLAVLQPLHALILVVLCIFLTMVAGLIPAIFASKKDPVNALRSE